MREKHLCYVVIINSNNVSTALRTHHVLGSHLRAIHASSVVPKYGKGGHHFPFKDPKLKFREV